MKSKLFMIALSLVFFACGTSTDRQKEERIEEILTLSEMHDITRMLHRIVESELQSVRSLMDSARFASIYKEAVEIYSVGNLWDDVESEFGKKYQPDHAEQVLKWMRSGTFRKIISAENKQLTLEDRQKLLALRSYLEKDEELYQRYVLLKSVMQDEEINLMVHAFTELKKSLFDKVLPFVKTESTAINPDQVDAMIHRDAALLRRQLKEEAVLERLFRYRYIQREDLEAYVQFSNSEAGRWVTISIYESISHAVDKASQKFTGN